MTKIRTEKNIAIAHMVQTADEDSPCRRLHGHNLKIIIEMEDDVKDDGMVLDFRHIKEIINYLDHYTLFPAKIVTSYENSYIIKTDYTMFSLPMKMCRILPIPVITAEYLAEYLWLKIYQLSNNAWLRVTIYESEKSYASVDNDNF